MTRVAVVLLVAWSSALATGQSRFQGPWDRAADTAAEEAVARLGATAAMDVRETVLTIPALAAVSSETVPPMSGVTPITFADGRVSFLPPVGFTPLDQRDMASSFPRADPVTPAIGDASRDTTITYQLVPARVSATALGRFRESMAREVGGGFTNVRWAVNENRQRGGREWAHLEFTEGSGAEERYHIMVITALDGEHLIMFTLNMLARDTARLDPMVRAAIASIVVRA